MAFVLVVHDRLFRLAHHFLLAVGDNSHQVTKRFKMQNPRIVPLDHQLTVSFQVVELLQPGSDYVGSLDSLYDGDQPVIEVGQSWLNEDLWCSMLFKDVECQQTKHVPCHPQRSSAPLSTQWHLCSTTAATWTRWSSTRAERPSCSPGIFSLTRNRMKSQLTTRRDIKVGEEVSDFYGQHYFQAINSICWREASFLYFQHRDNH